MYCDKWLILLLLAGRGLCRCYWYGFLKFTIYKLVIFHCADSAHCYGIYLIQDHVITLLIGLCHICIYWLLIVALCESPCFNMRIHVTSDIYNVANMLIHTSNIRIAKLNESIYVYSVNVESFSSSSGVDVWNRLLPLPNNGHKQHSGDYLLRPKMLDSILCALHNGFFTYHCSVKVISMGIFTLTSMFEPFFDFVLPIA